LWYSYFYVFLKLRQYLDALTGVIAPHARFPLNGTSLSDFVSLIPVRFLVLFSSS
jgi:hypothetical protein